MYFFLFMTFTWLCAETMYLYVYITHVGWIPYPTHHIRSDTHSTKLLRGGRFSFFFLLRDFIFSRESQPTSKNSSNLPHSFSWHFPVKYGFPFFSLKKHVVKACSLQKWSFSLYNWVCLHLCACIWCLSVCLPTQLSCSTWKSSWSSSSKAAYLHPLYFFWVSLMIFFSFEEKKCNVKGQSVAEQPHLLQCQYLYHFHHHHRRRCCCWGGD